MQSLEDLMNNLREFILNQSTKINELFTKNVLKSFWNDWHIHVWNSNKSFTKFTGNEVALFVSNIENVIDFINNNFFIVDKTRAIITGMRTWVSIFKFLGITYINDSSK